MTLCEALDWCRQHRAIVQFSPDSTTIVLGGQIDAFPASEYKGSTIEEATKRADEAFIEDRLRRAPLEE